MCQRPHPTRVIRETGRLEPVAVGDRFATRWRASASIQASIVAVVLAAHRVVRSKPLIQEGPRGA